MNVKGGLGKVYDVIVVGAGPSGSLAAKKCAEMGLKSLILEKYRLPRDKVCSGMIMGPVAHALIRQEFGDLPESVLTDPSHLSGYVFHVPGVGSEKLNNFTRLSWRRNLDYWMNERAQASGVELWQEASVIDIKQQTQGFLITIRMGEQLQDLMAEFVIGADGGNSTVRSFLFPDLKVKYGQVYQEHYRGELNLDKDYMHWFYPVEHSPASFTAHQKDGLIIVDVGCSPGKAKQLMTAARKYLAENHGLDLRQEPVWRGGCLQPALYRELTSHTFRPAHKNALLVGDAAGLVMPVSGEGIGTGMKSALIAASSIKKAEDSNKPAEVFYLSELNNIISLFGEIYPWFKKIADEAKSGGNSLPGILRNGYFSTLRVF
jgi:flavin-dependent dehydrogenase